MVYDLSIVGASAAGVSAAIYAARRKLNFVMLAKDIGGEVATSGEIENYPGFSHTDGIALTEKFKEQLAYNHVEIQHPVTVSKIEPRGNIFRIQAEGDAGLSTYEAKTVIVTSGVHPRQLNVPGEKELRGRGVTYCTTCDGPLFKGKRVATIGGGNSALESGLMLADLAASVWVINKNPTFKGDTILIDGLRAKPNVTILSNALTKTIAGEQKVTGVEVEREGRRETLPVDGVFIHIGMVPNSDFVDVRKSRFGEIAVDDHCQTSTPGLFAAGDVTNVPYKQIGIAVGQGIIASLAAIEYLHRWKG